VSARVCVCRCMSAGVVPTGTNADETEQIIHNIEPSLRNQNN
jgi:hypothetical protein